MAILAVEVGTVQCTSVPARIGVTITLNMDNRFRFDRRKKTDSVPLDIKFLSNKFSLSKS